MTRYSEVQLIAGKGNAAHEFSRALRGIAADSRNQVYAVGDQELKIFDSSGKLQRRWGLSRPAFSVAAGPDGRIWAGQEGQIEVFDSTGRLLDTWRDPGRLGLVTAIGFTPGGVLVGDARDRAIQRYDEGGRFLNHIGKDNRMKGFLIPNGVLDFAVDMEGVVHAANPGKHRVERYNLEGKLLGHFGRFDGRDPAGFTGCCNPTNVALAGRDLIAVTEKAGPRVKLYDFSGRLLSVIADEVFDPNCKNMDVAVDSGGRVLVADTVKLTVFVFAPAAAGQGTARS